MLLNEQGKFQLDVQNNFGQGYDIGTNIKNVQSGVQKRLLNNNSRAFFTPYAYAP